MKNLNSNNPAGSAGSHQEFLISDIMPRREVHIICGPSGVGKTNLTLAGLKAIREGGEWLGKKIPAPVSIFYISVDRSRDSVKRALDRHRIPHDLFPWTVGMDVPPGASGNRAYDVISWIHSQYRGVEFIFIDGFVHLLRGSVNDYEAVADFLHVCQKACMTHNLTILGSAHSPKLRGDDSIPNPRQRVMGSAAWGGFADLIIVLDPEDEEDVENLNRICRVLPRDSAEYVLHFRNERGILVPVDPDEEQSQFKDLEKEIEQADPGTTWSTQNLRGKIVTSKASFHRWLALAVASGLLVKISRGSYQRFG